MMMPAVRAHRCGRSLWFVVALQDHHDRIVASISSVGLKILASTFPLAVKLRYPQAMLALPTHHWRSSCYDLFILDELRLRLRLHESQAASNLQGFLLASYLRILHVLSECHLEFCRPYVSHHLLRKLDVRNQQR